MSDPRTTLDGSLAGAVRYAVAASPRYRSLLAGELELDSFGARELQGLPFTIAADLVASPAQFRARRACTVYASSGTTGRPKYMFFSEADHVATVRRTAASLQAAGIGPDDVLAVAHGFGIWLIGADFARAGETLGACVLPVGKGPTAEYVLDALRANRVTAIASSPSYLRRLAGSAEARDGAVPRVATLVLSGETLAPTTRSHLRTQWSAARVVSVYGSAECGTLACERPGSDVLDLHDQDFAFEVVDPATDERVGAGAAGELVLTSLRQEAMPLMRYRTGDLVQLVDETPDGLARGVRVLGRLDESVVLESGEKLWPHQIDDALSAVDGVATWQATIAELPSDGPWLVEHDVLTVDLVLTTDAGDVALLDRARTAIAACSLDMTAAAQATVAIEVRAIEASSLREAERGKALRIVDQRRFPTVRPIDAAR